MKRVVPITVGGCLIALGGILLLYSYDILKIPFPWSYLRKIWPAFIILAGLYLITGNSDWRARIRTIAVVIFIIWIFGYIGPVFNITRKVKTLIKSSINANYDINVNSGKDTQSSNSNSLDSILYTKIDIPPNIKEGSLKIDGGLLNINVNDTNLPYVYIIGQNYRQNPLGVEHKIEKGKIYLIIAGKAKENLTLKKSTKKLDNVIDVHIGLPLNLKWEINTNIGLSKFSMSFEKSIPKEVEINGGLVEFNCKVMPKLLETLQIRIRGGLSEFNVYTNSNNCVKINSSTFLSNLEVKENGKIYSTSDILGASKFFETSNCKENNFPIVINLEGAISSCNIYLVKQDY